ncbi:glycoside hydrolase family 43 protein [Cordyceps javanica]|uniref:Glycoside hydrolase family 43 protein n=1 Tax=Cordyceps javanica TaxID=43265 RepID=A0A545UR00_9HYPO|nr:glycoside hydrolase family 43 protein [Cordyceps javanica]TQW03836.1 glycoside hydrolase family 43 protein [Cordyceps javanica]
MATEADYERLSVWAAMLNPDANINRRGAKRTVEMQVLSLGLPRTGTVSMREAYSILGYAQPYHFASIVENCKDADMWNEALRAKFNGIGKPYGRAEFDQLLGESAAVSDTPCCIFWAELIEAYPEAKVVLVDRDEERWLASVGGLIDGALNPFGQYVLRFTDPFWFGRIFTCGRLWIGGYFGSADPATAKNNAREVYRRHYDAVRRVVPKDRLLEYKLGSGWGPLCRFLGTKVPDVPFPHRNEADILAKAFGASMGKALKNSALNIALVITVVGGTLWGFSKMMT